MLQELLRLNAFGVILIFARVGTAFATLPGFSAAYVSVRIRLVCALVISLVLAPVLIDSLPGLPTSSAALGLLLIGEVLIGGFLGLLGRVLFAALQTAGTVISLVSSLANAFVQDAVSEQQGSIIAGFLTTVGLLVIFTSNLHHLMIRALADSYGLFIPGDTLALGDMAQLMARHVMDSFALGVQLASPFIVMGLTHYLMLGLLGRLMPALPVFFFGLPIQLAAQIAIIMLTLSGIMLAFQSHFAESFGAFLAP